MAATVRIAILADAGKAKEGFDTAEKAAAGFSQRIEVMTNGFDNFGGRVGDASSALSGMAPAIEALGFTDAAAKMETAIIALDAIEGATMLFSVAQSAANVVMNSGKLALVGQTIAAGAHAVALGVVRGATIAWTAVQWALNAALTANPIGLIIAAIALLVAAFVIAYKKSETFRNIVNGALKAVQKVALAVWNAIKTAASAVWSFISKYVTTQINIVRAVITGVRNFINAAWNLIKAGAQKAWAFIKSYIQTQINLVKAVFNGLKTLVVTGWNTIKSAASKVWSSIKSAVSSAMSSAKDKFNDLKSTASSVLSRIKSLFSGSALVSAGRRLIEGLADGVRAKINAVVDVVKAGVARIKGLLPGSPIKWGPLKGWNNGGAGKRLMGMLASGIQAGAPGVERQLSSVLSSIASPVITPSMAGLDAGSIARLSSVGASGGVVQNITLEVRVDPSISPEQAGKTIAKYLESYRRAGGRVGV